MFRFRLKYLLASVPLICLAITLSSRYYWNQRQLDQVRQLFYANLGLTTAEMDTFRRDPSSIDVRLPVIRQGDRMVTPAIDTRVTWLGFGQLEIEIRNSDSRFAKEEIQEALRKHLPDELKSLPIIAYK